MPVVIRKKFQNSAKSSVQSALVRGFAKQNMRETGWSLSAVGVGYLRGAAPSKKLLLPAVMRDDKERLTFEAGS